MKIAIEAQRIFRKNKHGMDFVALEAIRELQELDKQNEYYILVSPGEDRGLCFNGYFHKASDYKLFVNHSNGVFGMQELVLQTTQTENVQHHFYSHKRSTSDGFVKVFVDQFIRYTHGEGAQHN